MLGFLQAMLTCVSFCENSLCARVHGHIVLVNLYIGKFKVNFNLMFSRMADERAKFAHMHACKMAESCCVVAHGCVLVL